MKFTDTLDHFCVKAAHLHIHPQPEYFVCTECADEQIPDAKLHLTHETVQRVGAKQADGSVSCPDCGKPMEHSGPRHFADLHVDICLDKTAHYPQMLAAKEISAEEYQKWFGTLTDREKNGQYDRVPAHHLAIKLNHAEVDLMEKDPAAFQALLHAKLEARLEVDAQFILQHRYKHEVKKVNHLLTEFKK